MEYQLGYEYVDKGKKTHPDDQFLRWINIEGSGIRNTGGIRALNYVSKNSEYLPAYIILVSNENKVAGNFWEDTIHYNSSTILYWGDAKLDKKKSFSDFTGNRRLYQTWEAILDNRLNEVPPILHFSKPKKGIVKFNGLCILSDLQITWFEQNGIPVKNYRCELTILDKSSVKVEWLHSRATTNDIKSVNHNAPKIWKDYINGNTRKLNLWSKKILSKKDQLPEINTRENVLLRILQNLDPFEFEAVVVELFKKLPHVNHKIEQTRSRKDGGFDFFGEFSIPHPVNYEIKFLGEVKKFCRNNGVQPKDVSRLVARLNRGQFGIFVTTSYYTKQTQEEVLKDNYPIKLFSGKDLINMLHELKLVKGNQINEEWLSSIVHNSQ